MPRTVFRFLVFRFLIGCGLALCLAAPAGASEAAKDDRASTGKAAGKTEGVATPVPGKAPTHPTYRPPIRGKPRARIAGGVRGGETNLPRLQVLAPQHTGQTLSGQPSFFWYLDRTPPEGAAFAFTLVDDTRIEPLLEAPLEGPPGAGIHRIDLADYGVRLQKGVEYEWSVVLVVDPEQRSMDIVSVSWVDRVEAPPHLGEAGPPGVHVYAEHGLWYDALAAASDEVEAHPEDPLPRAHRDALLRQVGLDLAVSGAAR